MNLFAFVAWLEQNRHAHSENRLTINDGYEWYNYMWNIWLKNSDVGRGMMMNKKNNFEQINQDNPVTRGSTALVYKQETIEEMVMGINNIPDNTDENITTDKNTNHPRWTSTTTWDNLYTKEHLEQAEQFIFKANNNQSNTKIANPYEDNCVYIDELMLSIYVDMYLDHGHFDFNVPEWIDDEWDGDAEKELASDVLYSFRMFLENRDWVDEDNEDRDAAKWGDFIIQ